MNKLIIPPSPNWFSSNILACAPDNTVIYGSRNDIVVINPTPLEEPGDIKILAGIHSARIVSVAVNRNWGNPNKWAVSVGEDNVVQLLDISTFTSKISHAGHKTHADKVIGAEFAGEDRVISVSEKGFIIIWKLSTSNLSSISTIKDSNVKVSTISICPHATWLIAIGTKKGGILISDLKKSGRVIFRIKAHEEEIISLSWCPAPHNVFSKKIVIYKRKDNEKVQKEEHGLNNEGSLPDIVLQPAVNIELTDNSIETESSEDQKLTDSINVQEITEDVALEQVKEIITESINVQEKTEDVALEEVKKTITESINVQERTEDVALEEAKKTITDSINVQEITEDVELEEVKKTTLETRSDSSTETLTDDKTENNTLDTQNKIDCVINGDKHDDHIKSSEGNEKIYDEEEKNKNITNNSTETKLNGELTKKQLNKQEFLLASTSRGSRSIKIWRAGTDSLLEAELIFPKVYSSRSKSGSDRSWITACWVTPRSLLSSASKAQLLHWRLDENRKNNENYKPRLLHTDHSKQLFCIAAPIRKHESADDEDWRDKNLLNAWSLGSDRFILNTSLGCDHKTLSCYATIGGAITCLVPSPIDPTRIACGMGDGSARMIDLSRPHLQTLSMNALSDKNQIKITSFAWHPKKEACLAYGTQEGHVGLIDTTSSSKNITELVPSGNHPLYHLQWGPLNDDSNHELYVISNSKLVAYDVKKPLNGPTEIDINNGIGLTSFVWKHDYSILAVATKNCELLLYDNHFKLMATFLLQSKTVRCLEWHPPGTAEENWLALSTNQIIVYDCSASNLKTQNKYEDCAIAVLSEHQGCVHAISWSPHQSELLASAGDVGIALVWNVKTKTLLHACVSQFDLFYDVLWSPLDADYLITGGRGCVLRIWKLSENPPSYKIDKAQQKQTLLLEKSQANEEVPMVKVESKPKRTAKCLLNGISQIHNLNVHSDMLQDCIKLFNSLHSKNYENPCKNTKPSKDVQSSVFNILDLFEGKEGIDEILKLERENHANRTTPLCMESISLWQGNIGDTIKNAIMCESLNHWLISIAPMVSYNLWQEACEAYAKQLLNESNNKPVEAAYYFLACHKVEEAIEALCFGCYYREALILAKSRLSASDPLIDNILKRWASYSTLVGKYEIAAQCYIVLNMLEEAAKVLFRRTDVPILEFCVKLAEEIGNEELLKATLFRLDAITSASNNKSGSDDTLLPLKSRAELEIQKVETNGDNSVTTDNDVVASVEVE